MGTSTILVVEDCPDTARAIQLALGRSHDVRLATSVAEVRELNPTSFDLALIDLGLPDGSGFDACRHIQEQAGSDALPVIFLTASRDTRDKVTAFQLDADDYVEKPFDGLELKARVDARLRKSSRSTAEAHRIRIGPLQLDAASHRAWARDGDEMELTPHEFQLLHLLGTRAGDVVSRAAILETVWRGVAVTRRTVDTHVCNLRRKLRGLNAELDLETVRGVGYRLRVGDA